MFKDYNNRLITRYVWQDQLRIIAELDSNNLVKSRFVYAEGVNSPEYMVKNGEKFLFVKDHRGSINLVVHSETGEIFQKLRYSDWGEVLEDTNPGFQPFGFAGGLYDPDTKLVRFGARDYDPEIGRWLSKDPIRFDGGDGNLYGYTFNDPINLIDLTGENAVIPAVIAVGAIWLGYQMYDQYKYYTSGEYLKEQTSHPQRDPDQIPRTDLNNLPMGCPVPNSNYIPKEGRQHPYFRKYNGV